jgi:uncharacterized protein YkwD
VIAAAAGRIAACVLAALLLSAPADAAATKAKESPTAELLREMNRVRAEHKLAPLAADHRLMQAAQRHTEDMARNIRLDHQGSDGSRLGERVKRAGYAYMLVAENIAAGYATAAQTVKSWLDSPLHRNNLLDPEIRDAGVGYVFRAADPGAKSFRYYWTANFGRRLP